MNIPELNEKPCNGGKTEPASSATAGELQVIETSQGKVRFAVLATAFIVSVCGISYELLSATISSYFLGNAVLQYSLTIGIFLFAMGIGSYLSGKFERNLPENFITIEILIGLFGGFSTVILFTAYMFTEVFSLVMYGVLLILGILIGLEIPILIRILKSYTELRFSIADVLSFDYAGALAASILFPLLILPHMGIMHAAFFYALLNMVIVFLNLKIFGSSIGKKNLFKFLSVIVTVILTAGFIFSTNLVTFFESRLYDDEIILTKQTKYQRIVMTRFKEDTRLFLDGNLQFSSWDEYRYHECLVIPAMSLSSSRREVLILGGGDGLAAREVLKFPDVENVTLVDIDPDMVELCRKDPVIRELNKGSLDNPRLKIISEDAFKYMAQTDRYYDVIIVDLPDPNSESLSKLYTKSFYNLLRMHLSKGGMISIQSTSPFFSRKSFWCIVHTVESAGLYVLPYHEFVPSFGDWGFTLASNVRIFPDKITITVPVKFLNHELVKKMFLFGKDSDEVETEINTLNTHSLLRYYDNEWENWE